MDINFCVLCVSLICALFTSLRYVCFYLVLFLVWGSSLFTRHVNEQELNYIEFCQLSLSSFSFVLLSTCNEISCGSKRKGTCNYFFAGQKCSSHQFAWLYRNDQCTAKSDVAEPTQNPIWNATFDFPNVPGEELMDKTIEVTLWDYCPDRDSVFLGECP